MEQDRQKRELEFAFAHLWAGISCLATGDQPGQTEGALQSVLQIVILGIDRLIIVKLTRETRLGPIEGLRHKTALSAWKQLPINAINLFFHRAWRLRIH